jgi:hypothetical protein
MSTHLDCIVTCANRAFEGSTDVCIMLPSLAEECFVALANPAKLEEGCLGYLRFVLFRHWDKPATEIIQGQLQYIFVLAEVLPSSYPAPLKSIPLSGVLWSRLAAIEAHRSISSYQKEGGQIG